MGLQFQVLGLRVQSLGVGPQGLGLWSSISTRLRGH